MIFHENHLPSDDFHEISCLKKQQNLKLSFVANYRWCFMGSDINRYMENQITQLFTCQEV